MSNLAYLPTPRTLAHVLLEIGDAELQRALLQSAADLDLKGYLARGDDYRAGAIDDRLSALRSEGRKLVQFATGCSFDDLAERLS